MVVLLASGSMAACGGSSSPSAASASPASAGGDQQAEAAIARALKVVAGDWQDFGNYDFVSPFTLGNIDHKLRAVKGLAADGHGKTFNVSVRSAGGTTFTIHGVRLRLRRTCAPVGPDCKHGTWRGGARLALPKVPVVSKADKAHVRRILTASVNHFAHLLVLGQQALGTTPYASATAGLAAFNDPNSAASRFRDYRSKYRAEQDLSYLAAFKRADSYYTAANEPQAISAWQDDMTAAATALSEWVNVAVGWQIREKSNAQLNGAAGKVDAALARARRDISQVVAGRK